MAKTVEDTLLVRMEASLRKFERQMERGRKVAANSAVASEQAWDKAGKMIAANANRATTGLNRLNASAGAGRFVLQNTASQIGDIAVQIQGGTNASRALGQQLPQLFGGFSALGGGLGVVAPLLGTVAAIGIPVATSLMNISDAAETLDDKMKALKESINAVKSAQDLSATSATDLLSSYGDLADEASEIFEINRQIAAIRASTALTDVGQKFGGQIGGEGLFGLTPEEVRDLEEAIASYRLELESLQNPSQMSDIEFAAADLRIDEIEAQLKSLKEVRDSVDDIAELFGITADQARELAAQIAAAGSARGAREQAEAWSEVSSYLNAIIGTQQAATEEGEKLRAKIVELNISALELSKVDLASPVERGTDAAREFSQALWDAVSAKNALEGNGVSGGRGEDPRQHETDPYWRRRYFPEPENIAEGRRRSGRGAALDPGLREAQQLFRSTRTEAEAYADEMERIDELHRKFPQVVTAEVRDRAVEALNDAASAAEDMGKRMESSFSSAFSSLVAGAGSGREAVQALIADLARMAAQSAWGSLMGDAGGGFFNKAAKWIFGGANANGNAYRGGAVTPFASGGVVGAPTYFPMAGGKAGLMGEAGPEAIMPLARVNGKLGVRANQTKQAGGHVTVAVTLSDDLDARISSRSQNISVTTVREYDRTVLPGRVGQIIRDPRKKN